MVGSVNDKGRVGVWKKCAETMLERELVRIVASLYSQTEEQ